MIRIITDSACDLTRAEAAALNIDILPLKVTFEDEDYLDGIDIDHDTFYSKLIETDVLPHTSQVNPFDYEKKFEEITANGDTVICITLSSKLSGCYQSACIAADEFEGKVFVIDSLNACVGQRILVERAIALREEGLTAEEISSTLEKERHNICLIGLLDTLEYLKKGGRISPAVAAACKLLSIKPVITIDKGAVELLGKARGSKNGCNKLTEYIEKSNGIDFTKPFCLAYSGLSDHLLKKYIEDSKALYRDFKGEIPVSSIGSAIGTHIGPGAIALAYFKKA